jgi:hypothetical protein
MTKISAKLSTPADFWKAFNMPLRKRVHDGLHKIDRIGLLLYCSSFKTKNLKKYKIKEF